MNAPPILTDWLVRHRTSGLGIARRERILIVETQLEEPRLDDVVSRVNYNLLQGADLVFATGRFTHRIPGGNLHPGVVVKDRNVGTERAIDLGVIRV